MGVAPFELVVVELASGCVRMSIGQSPQAFGITMLRRGPPAGRPTALVVQ